MLLACQATLGAGHGFGHGHGQSQRTPLVGSAIHAAAQDASTRSARPPRRASPKASPGVAATSGHDGVAGRKLRSAAARRAFKRSHPCPSTGKPSGACPGHVIDHVVPLKRGGADSPRNMQWQTSAAAKAKDRSE